MPVALSRRRVRGRVVARHGLLLGALIPRRRARRSYSHLKRKAPTRTNKSATMMSTTRVVRPSASAQRSMARSKPALLRLPGNRVAISRQMFNSSPSSRRADLSCMAVLGDVRSPGFRANLLEDVRKGVREGKRFTLLKATPTAIKVGRKNIPEEFVRHIVEFEATDSGFSVTDGPPVHVCRKAKTMNVHATFLAADGAVTRRLVGLKVRAVVRRNGYKEYQVYGLHTYLRAMGAGQDDLVLMSTDGRQGCDTALQVLVIPQGALDQEARDELAPFLIGKTPACCRAAHKPRRVKAKKVGKAAVACSAAQRSAWYRKRIKGH